MLQIPSSRHTHHVVLQNVIISTYFSLQENIQIHSLMMLYHENLKLFNPLLLEYFRKKDVM